MIMTVSRCKRKRVYDHGGFGSGTTHVCPIYFAFFRKPISIRSTNCDSYKDDGECTSKD